MTRLLRKLGTVLLALPLWLLNVPLPAGAQTTDQTAFEKLFGEPVTTSATGEPQRVSEVPSEMTIITAADISRAGVDNIPDMLRFVPGMDVRTYGMQDAAVGIRGYNTALNPRVLVLLDGRQVYQDDYGLTVWSLIPVTMNEIRQIEIIKGPSAALYGFNAVSGVINIITYDPLRDRVNAARIDGGTQNRVSGEAVATAQIDNRVGLRLSAKGFRATDFDAPGSTASREQPHSGMVAADVRLQLAPHIEWDLSASISSVDSEYYVDTGLLVPTGFKANSLRSRLTADTRLGMLELDAYRNEARTSENTLGVIEGWRQDVSIVRVDDLLKLGRHTLRLAAEYRDNAASAERSFQGRVGYVDVAGSLMWEWRILPWLVLTNAGRIDDLSLDHRGTQFTVPGVGDLYHGVSIVEPSFNSGVVMKLGDYDTVRLTAARAAQLPSLVDFGYVLDLGAAVVAGNSDLRPAPVMNYEVDYDHVLTSLSSTLRLSLFAQQSASSIGSPFGSSIVVTPTGVVVFAARNFGGSSEAGGELGIKGSNLAGLRWEASYSLAAVHDDSARADLLHAPSVSYQRQTPTHSIIVGGGYSWHRFDLDAHLRWQSHFNDFVLDLPTRGFKEVTVANYVTLDTRLGYRVNDRIGLAVLVQQLNRQSIVETGGVPVARRVLASVKVRF